MTMTNQRRRELIEILEGCELPGRESSVNLTRQEAQHLLALLREEGLEWCVKAPGVGVIGKFLHRDDAVLFCNRTEFVEPTFTGPDEGENPIPKAVMPSGCPGCGGPTEYDREDPPSPYYCEKCEYEYAIEATGCPPKSHTNTMQFDGIPENVVI